MGLDSVDGINDDEGKDEAPMAATSTSRAAILIKNALNKDNKNSKGDEDNEYLPNSNDLDSDENGRGYKSYKLGDL